MNVSVIISEYNPFHRGHEYLIKRAKDSGATHIIAIMSGNFVQRGDLAITSKYDRTKMALLSGVDLVIELPVIWALSSAEYFSDASIKIANSLGCINTLSFGSECGDIDSLKNLAEILNYNNVKAKIQEKMSSGINYPKARETTIEHLYGDKLSNILKSPNNILALEYLKSLNKLNSKIKPFTIARKGNNHDETILDSNFPSASYIRNLIYNNKDYSNLLPKASSKILKENINNFKAPANIYSIQAAILSKLRTMNKNDLYNICDVSEGLENRIYKSIKVSKSLNELYASIKTKRYTLSKIRRIILCSYLGITKKDLKRDIPYIRILGFNSSKTELLKNIKKNSSLPIITKKSDVDNLNSNSKHIFNLEVVSTDLYNLSTPQIQKCGLDISQKMIIV